MSIDIDQGWCDYCTTRLVLCNWGHRHACNLDSDQVLTTGLSREWDDGLFRPITYLCAKILEEVIIAFLGCLIFSWWVFFATELHGSYALFLLVHYLTTSIGIGNAPTHYKPTRSGVEIQAWAILVT